MDFTPHMQRLVDALSNYSATWTPAAGGGPFSIKVFFTNDYREFEAGTAAQSGRQPECLVRDDEIAQAGGMKRGDTLEIDGTVYVVANTEPDSSGATRVELKQ